ncbi:hypothetical protein KI387_012965, partial [Taxus chinensis]
MPLLHIEDTPAHIGEGEQEIPIDVDIKIEAEIGEETGEDMGEDTGEENNVEESDPEWRVTEDISMVEREEMEVEKVTLVFEEPHSPER